MIEEARLAKDCARKMAVLDAEIKNKALEEIANSLKKNKNIIFEANEQDLDLMAFIGEMTRNAAITQETPDEKDFRKILEYVLGQEVSRK